MNGIHILELNRTELADLILDHRQDLPPFRPQTLTPWIAMSLMQKAIRRGRVDLALMGAATLLQDSPERLWRRLGITAFEDIGVGDFDAVSLTMAGLTGKVWRKGVGGDWAVASYLVQRMCESVKCRATDDLIMVCTHHPSLAQERYHLPEQNFPELMNRITGKGPMSMKALAMWFAVGTDRFRADELQRRCGEPQAVMDALCDSGIPDTVVEVCREGFKKTNEILPAFIPLLWRKLQSSNHHVEPDDLPPDEIIGNVPCWVYDMHTRDGKRAMAHFLKMDSETSRWMREHTPSKGRSNILGEMLFRIESGCVDRRLNWDVGNCIRRMADLEGYDLTKSDAEICLALFRNDLPVLNEARRIVIPNL